MSAPHRPDPAALPRHPRRAEVDQAAARAVADAEQLRTLVLGHPDLAERLTHEPLGFAQPAQWNGYIPPLMTCAQGGQLNTSPQRAALIGICADAMARELGAEAAEAWRWTTG